jgi:hypothetical protein
MQYSTDGINWNYIRINDQDIIEDQEGTVPIISQVSRPAQDDLTIEDAVW